MPAAAPPLLPPLPPPGAPARFRQPWLCLPISFWRAGGGAAGYRPACAVVLLLLLLLLLVLEQSSSRSKSRSRSRRTVAFSIRRGALLRLPLRRFPLPLQAALFDLP